MGARVDFYLVDGDGPRALFSSGLETGIDFGVYSDDAPAFQLGFEGISARTVIGAGGLKDHPAESFDANKKQRLVLFTGKDGSPAIRFIDPDNRVQRELKADVN